MTLNNNNHLNVLQRGQVETLQEDLQRISGLVAQLIELSDEELAILEISDHLDAIHRSLNRFEARCLTLHVATHENEFPDPFMGDFCKPVSHPNLDWGDVRKNAKRANRLANQLTLTLHKIRSHMDGVQAQNYIPKDIVQINMTIDNGVGALASEWNANL